MAPPNDWAKQMLLNGGVNPLYGPQQPDPSAPAPPPDPQRGSIAAAMPQTPQAPSQPAQPSPAPASAPPAQPPTQPSAPPQRGAISDAMPQSTSAPSSPAVSQNAPIAGAPAEYKHGTLAKILLGVGEALGNPLATRIGQRDREREQEIAEYNRPGNVAALQQKANLGQQQAQAEIGKEQAQTEEAKSNVKKTDYEMGKEQQTAKANAISQIMGEVESGKFGDGSALLGRWRRIAGANPHLGLTDEDIQGAIAGTHPLGSKYTLNRDPQTQAPIELVDREGNHYSKSNLPADPQAQQMWGDAENAASGKLKTEEGKEKRVAGYAAERQGAAFAQANRMEAVKKVQPHIDEALGADERLGRMESSYKKAVNGDQQAMLALLSDHLGMTMGLQKGARITKDVLQGAEESQPWLAKLGAKFDDRGYLSGVALGKDQMKQMLDLGYEARDRSYKSAHDASTAYEVPLPKGFGDVEQKRKPGDKPALGQQGGGGVQHVPGGKADGLQEGQTGTGSDGKKYVVKNGIWAPK